jgi:hypothetical protein
MEIERASVGVPQQQNGPASAFCSSLPVLGAALLLGVGGRFLSAGVGDNFDMESWWIASEASLAGESVYARTHRYNYGPVWFWIIGALREVSAMTGADTIARLHLFMTGFLTLIDLGIASLLYATVAPLAGILFFLNPISIATTGYHIQFDNFAVLTGLIAWLLFMQARSQRQVFLAAVLLGLSLSIKHVFLLFLGWLPFLTTIRSTTNRLWFGAVSLAIFFGSFSPWIGEPLAWRGIQENVFGYRSTEGHSLTSHLAEVVPWMPPRILFMLLTVSAGATLARFTQLHRFAPYLYLVTLTALSSGMARNYLAIPLVGLFASGYTRCGAAYLIVAALIFFTVTPSLGTHEVIAHLLSSPIVTYELAQTLLLGAIVETVRRTRA